MPNAVDNASHRALIPEVEIEDFRIREGLSAVTGCFVGRLEQEKGVDILIRAVADMRRPLSLVVAGDGTCLERLRALADALGAGERVRFVGWLGRQELRMLYQASDFLVLPSVPTRFVKETWGVVVNEAMNAGVPVIATDAVGAAAGGLVRDGFTGLVVPAGDVMGLAFALDRLAGDENARRRMGSNARDAVASYTFEAAAAAFEQAISHSTSHRRRPCMPRVYRSRSSQEP
jgi:glycosyltransferase involved in cell wall biosynthesis